MMQRQQELEAQRQQTQQLQKNTVRAPFPLVCIFSFNFHITVVEGTFYPSSRQVDTVDLPPTAERCSLKTSEYYINSIDTSKIHNMKGIDVWASNPPKPWNEKSSTLPRSKFQMGIPWQTD